MSCNGCYQGCVDITSDQCVKYTGSDIALLGIETNDPLSTVISQISTYLLSTMTGEGIIPTIETAELCTLISGFLPSSGDITLNDVISALIQSICSLQTQITALSTTVDGIDADYVIGCLTGVAVDSGTHSILQAVITELCSTVQDISSLIASLSQYVEIADLNGLIQDYLDTLSSTKYYNRMVPYCAVEFYGDPAGKFDITGKGITGTDWEQIYLCNGQNGTPDKRGRLPVGTTSMGNTAFDAVVDPGISGNPPYDLLDTEGANNVAITSAQMPSHNHLAISTINDPGHRHLFGGDGGVATDGSYSVQGTFAYNAVSTNEGSGKHMYTKSENNIKEKASQITNITASTQVQSTGGGQVHRNIPPVLACHYIIYLPTP